jgi:hypothetical protein
MKEAAVLAYSWTLKMEAIYPSKGSGFLRNTPQYDPEDYTSAETSDSSLFRAQI